MKLPHAELAFIDERKLGEYCLSKSHPVGKHKAVVFESALGLTDRDSERLRELILNAVVGSVAKKVREDEFGVRYEMDFPASTETGNATIRTAWIVRSGEDFPRLTTCFVLART